MSGSREIKAILPDATISVTESSLSYIKCLMPRSMSDKMFLFYRDQASSQNLQRKSSVLDDSLSSALDVTGSPLQYELSYPAVDESFVENRNWKKEEELHLPLNTSEARELINHCLKHISKKEWSLPLMALCNGMDNEKTVLLGSHIEAGWFTSIQGCLSGIQRLSNIEETPAILLEQYTNRFSVLKHKVCTAVSSTYQLCGKRSGVVDSSDLTSGCFNGNLSIKVNWNTLSFHAPIRASTTTLSMEIIAGWNGSHLKKLWDELVLLHQYLNMLEQYNGNGQKPHTFTPSNAITWEEIKAKLYSLLTGATENTSYGDDVDDDHRGVAEDIKLEKHIDNARLRQNMDFADMLWELLISCADYTQVTSCIRIILHESQLGLATPQISSTNTARITKIISETLCQKRVSPMLDETLPLEILIDTGLEKLNRDFMYILLSANLIDLHDIQQILCSVQGETLFNIESYRKKLTSLAQLALCLEFTCLAQNYLHFSTPNLQAIFDYAFRECVSEKSAIKSFSDLQENRIQYLNVPLPTATVKHIVQGLPSSWCLTLSSESIISRITTVSHLSRTPILPPNIYCFDVSTEHEVYNVLKLNTSSIKIA